MPVSAGMETAEYQKMFEAEQSHFWFRGSRKVVFSWLDRAMDELGDVRVLRLLDVGAGTGGVLSRMVSRCDAWGVEASEAGAEFISRRGVRVVRGMLPHLPFRDDSFDVAVSLDVFEHVEQDLEAMREVRRVLRPGGRLITTVPALKWLWSEHDVALHHHRRYRLSEFRDRLDDAGFVRVRLSYYNSLLLPPIAAVRLAGGLKTRLFGERSGEPKSDVAIPPRPLNEALAAVFGSEAGLLRWVSLPLGASLIADLKA